MTCWKTAHVTFWKSHILFIECSLLLTRWHPNKLPGSHYLSTNHQTSIVIGLLWINDEDLTRPVDRVTSKAKKGAWYHYYDHTKTSSVTSKLRMVPTVQVDKVIWFKRGPQDMLILSFYNHIDHNKRTSLYGLPVKSTMKRTKVACDTIESTHVSSVKALPGKEWKKTYKSL